MRRPQVVNRAVREEAAEAELIELHCEKRRMDLQAARLFAVIDRSSHFVYRSCSSIGHFGEMNGYSDQEARILSAAGKALDFKPELEVEIISGRISLAAAAALSKVYEHPELMRVGDDWLLWAKKWSSRDLEREIKKRMREQESGEATSVLTAVLTCSGRQTFERAREVACRKKRKFLSEGETVEVLSEHYLDSFDPERTKPRKRRMPDTNGHETNGQGEKVQSTRTIAAEVKREVRARQGDRCAVPKCGHRIWLNFAHDHPHARNGSREADNLHLLCEWHHLLFDQKLMRIEGTPDRPVFKTSYGGEVGKPP